MSHSPFPPSAPSRLLIVTDAASGRWHYATELIRALHRLPLSICLAIVGPGPTSAQRSEVSAFSGVQVHDHPFALEWMPNPWNDIARAGEWLLELEERFDPDVIHLNHYCYGALPWNAPTLFTAHGDRLSWARAVGTRLPVVDEERYLSEMLAGLRAADQIVAPSHAALTALCDHYRPATSPHGNDLFRCAPRVIPHTRSREAYPSRPKREFILAAGCAGDPGKNIGALEYAARDLPWPLFHAGSTENPHGEPVDFHTIDCLGPLSPRDLANWMGLASIFVLPSLYEPTGLAATEAALCGCALVLADLPNLREQWCSAALFVNPEKPLEIAGALQKLIRTPDLRNRLAHLARKRALRDSTGEMAESYLECYRDLLARRGAATGLERAIR